MSDVETVMEQAKRVLWRCAAMGLALALVWYLAAIYAGDWICRVHGSRFALSPHDCGLVNYAGIAFLKSTTYLFFVVPAVAIHLVQRKRS